MTKKKALYSYGIASASGMLRYPIFIIPGDKNIEQPFQWSPLYSPSNGARCILVFDSVISFIFIMDFSHEIYFLTGTQSLAVPKKFLCSRYRFGIWNYLTRTNTSFFLFGMLFKNDNRLNCWACMKMFTKKWWCFTWKWHPELASAQWRNKAGRRLMSRRR